MFCYKECPWHGRGVALDHPTNAEEALQYGGFNRRLRKFPFVTNERPPTKISRRVAIVRKDLPKVATLRRQDAK